MRYLIKYGIMVALLATICINIIDPSMEHRIIQSIVAVGVLLIWLVDWYMDKLIKNINIQKESDELKKD